MATALVIADGPLRDATLAWGREVAETVAVIERAELRERVTAAAAPVLVAAANAPRLTAAHAEWALADLAAGADVSFGPGYDGGWYLVAMSAPHEPVFELLEGRGSLLGLGLEAGLLRVERLLESPADAAALARDPLLASVLPVSER